jgi:hypothetical protein
MRTPCVCVCGCVCVWVCVCVCVCGCVCVVRYEHAATGTAQTARARQLLRGGRARLKGQGTHRGMYRIQRAITGHTEPSPLWRLSPRDHGTAVITAVHTRAAFSHHRQRHRTHRAITAVALRSSRPCTLRSSRPYSLRSSRPDSLRLKRHGMHRAATSTAAPAAPRHWALGRASGATSLGTRPCQRRHVIGHQHTRPRFTAHATRHHSASLGITRHHSAALGSGATSLGTSTPLGTRPSLQR